MPGGHVTSARLTIPTALVHLKNKPRSTGGTVLFDEPFAKSTWKGRGGLRKSNALNVTANGMPHLHFMFQANKNNEMMINCLL